jgi:hypothetical protein
LTPTLTEVLELSVVVSEPSGLVDVDELDDCATGATTFGNEPERRLLQNERCGGAAAGGGVGIGGAGGNGVTVGGNGAGAIA